MDKILSSKLDEIKECMEHLTGLIRKLENSFVQNGPPNVDVGEFVEGVATNEPLTLQLYGPNLDILSRDIHRHIHDCPACNSMCDTGVDLNETSKLLTVWIECSNITCNVIWHLQSART